MDTNAIFHLAPCTLHRVPRTLHLVPRTPQLAPYIICLLLALSPAPSALSQIPQGFNYQAVAHNASGAPIANASIQIKAAILSDTLIPVIVYEELHNPVTTNPYGVFSLSVGGGLRQTGSVLSFAAINWNVSQLFLRIQVYHQGSWVNMGNARLWSVPYAMTAGDLAGPVGTLSVVGETELPDEALFEVKNRDGQTVFAVYSEGVRVYVDDGEKGLKGGFAVSGFGNEKAEPTKYFYISGDSIRAYIDAVSGKPVKGGFAVSGFSETKGAQEYMMITPDSSRIYIDDTSGKAKKGGFAVGGFALAKDGRTQYFNVSTDTSIIIKPSQNRILWYPLKNAFLAGRILIEAPDSVGINSFSTGYESKAIGDFSQALGFRSVAKGDFATAIGRNANASTNYSFAIGANVKASNDNSFAFGRNTNATGEGAFAFGYNTLAQGDDSYSFGTGSQATGTGSFALGFIGRDSANVSTVNTTASGNYSVAIGMGARSTSQGAIALGTKAQASGLYSFAAGYQTKTPGAYSYAFGHSTEASGMISLAMGNRTRAKGNVSTTFGYATEASGDYSTAFGIESKATSHGSTAFGLRSMATEWFTTAMGSYTVASGYGSMATGSSTQSKGLAAFTAGGNTITKGAYSAAWGYYSIARPFASFVIGQYNDTTAMSTTNWLGIDPLFICGNGTSDVVRSNAFTVFKDGRVAVANSSPTEMLDVNGNARFRSVGSGTSSASLSITSDGTLTTSTSDMSMKMNIIPITDAISKVMGMNGIYFNWIGEESGNKKVGFIAQELETVLPEVVYTNPVDGLKGINYGEVTAVIAEAVKEQQTIIEAQNEKIERLEKLVEQLLESR